MNGEEGARRSRLLLRVALLVLAGGGITSLSLDAPRNWLSFHVAFDVLMILAALGAVTGLWVGWRRAERAAMGLRRTLEEGRAERDAWRQSARVALEGLGEAIDSQFDAWSLTPAEREVAVLLLKGHSHKRIARVTGRSEHTVRQHAGAAYQKAGLGGRAELAAFFLEDLMLPQRDRGKDPGDRDAHPATGDPPSRPATAEPRSRA